MNPWVFIIIAGFAILMVLFGRNPVEEARQAREKRLAGKDPLIESIEEHNKKGKFTGMTFGINNNGSSGYTNGNGIPNPSTGAPSGYPSYMNPNPYATANPYPPPAPAAPAPVPPTNSYYPPPAPGTPPSSLQQPLGPRSEWTPPGIRLKNGEQLAFDGPAVYAVDSNGKYQPVPDGKYEILDGAVTMTIRGGKKIISN